MGSRTQQRGAARQQAPGRPLGHGEARPLRVAIDTTPLIGPRTGIGRLVQGLVEELERGDELSVRRIAFTWRGRAQAGARMLPLPARAAHLLWGHCDLVPIEWWSGRVDVVHGTNYVVPPARHAARLVSVHDLTAVRFPELCAPAALRFPGMVRRAVAGGADVHCDSAAVGAEVQEWLGCPSERIHVVHPGIPSTALPAGVGVEPSRPPYVLSLGTAEPRKDLPGLVRAFAELASSHKDLRLVLAGPPGWGSGAVDAAVDALAPALRSRVERPGWVDDARRIALLAGASVFAYPSLYEGFGFPPLEAMALGVPVVSTRAGSLPEVLGEACALVEPGDHEALAQAIGHLLVDTEARSAAATAGRAQAARYGWPQMATAMTAVYRELACAS